MSEASRPAPAEGDIPAPRSVWLLQSLDNDLGERFVSFDENGVRLESLRVRGDLLAYPGFASAVAGRARAAALDSPWLAPVRTLQNDDAGDLTVCAEVGEIVALRDLFAARDCDAASALALLEQTLYALSELHAAGPQVAHGAITLDRLAITPLGHVRVLDSAFGAALGNLAVSADRLFEELGILSVGGRIDQGGDVLQAAAVCAELLRGRPLSLDDVHDAPRIWDSTEGIDTSALVPWMRRAFHVDMPFADAREALEALQPLLPGTPATRARVVAALAERDASQLAVAALESVSRAPLIEAVPSYIDTASGISARHDKDVVLSGSVAAAAPGPALPHARWRVSTGTVAIVLLAFVVLAQGLYIAVVRSAPPAVAPAPPATRALAVPETGRVPQPPLAAPTVAVVATAGEAAPAAAPARPAPEVRPAALGGGWLAIRVPFDVDVYSNDQLVGTSRSARLMLPEGRHPLVFVNEALGFSASADVNVIGGRTTTIEVPVPDGVLHVNASPWAAVTIDGRSYGETPLGNVRLPLGSHEVIFNHPELGERRQTVVIAAGAAARLSVDFLK